MTAHTGQQVTEKTFADKAWLLFVGFTHCPEICPTTLAEMSAWLQELGGDADKVQGLLVTVDPERDTVELLREYMSSFDSRIVALRPEPAELPRFAENYKIVYRKTPMEGGGYTMDHTAAVLLFDRRGLFSGTIDFHEDRAIALEKIRRTLNGANPS